MEAMTPIATVSVSGLRRSTHSFVRGRSWRTSRGLSFPTFLPPPRRGEGWGGGFLIASAAVLKASWISSATCCT